MVSNPVAETACSSVWYPTVDKLAYRALGLVFRTKNEAQDHMDEDYERLTGKPLSRGVMT